MLARSSHHAGPVADTATEWDAAGITGVHAIVFTPAVARVRAFFRDVLDLQNIDAGGGWLIFALPPAELAVHPSNVPSHEICLLCADIEVTLAGLEPDGVDARRAGTHPAPSAATMRASWISLHSLPRRGDDGLLPLAAQRPVLTGQCAPLLR
jgi:hypothetical protein